MTAPIAIRRLNAADADFAQHLDHLLSWESVSDDAVNQRVLEIIRAVRERGDAAQRLRRAFHLGGDGRPVGQVAGLRVHRGAVYCQLGAQRPQPGRAACAHGHRGPVGGKA